MALILHQWLFLLLTSLPQMQYSTHLADNSLHPFYISVTEINHNPIEKTLEISCKIFTEDLETVLNTTANPKIDISNPKSKEQINKLLSQYLASHLQLRVNGQPSKLELLGFEEEREATWTYLQVSNVASVKTIEIMDSLLYDSYKEQINLVHVTVAGNRKSTRLNNPDSGVRFDF
jgi:hypothetical protein